MRSLARSLRGNRPRRPERDSSAVSVLLQRVPRPIMSGLGRSGPPDASFRQLSGFRLVGEQQPEVVLGVGVPSLGGLSQPGAGLGRLRRVQRESQQPSEDDLGIGEASLGGPAGCVVNFPGRSLIVARYSPPAPRPDG